MREQKFYATVSGSGQLPSHSETADPEQFSFINQHQLQPIYQRYVFLPAHLCPYVVLGQCTGQYQYPAWGKPYVRRPNGRRNTLFRDPYPQWRHGPRHQALFGRANSHSSGLLVHPAQGEANLASLRRWDPDCLWRSSPATSSTTGVPASANFPAFIFPSATPHHQSRPLFGRRPRQHCYLLTRGQWPNWHQC